MINFLSEKLRELFESKAKELLKDSDEEPQFPRITVMPPHTFNSTEEQE